MSSLRRRAGAGHPPGAGTQHLRSRGRRHHPVDRKPALRRHHPPLLAAPGRRAAGHDPPDYTVARTAAEEFYARLRELFAERRQITTFGPYSPGQAVAMKRLGIEGIYLGGWATSAKGSVTEDPGPGPRQLPAEPGARRGGADRARAARPPTATSTSLRSRMTEAAARRDARGRLPAVHHRRRRHRPRRRRARAQPDPPLRRGRRARLPHRGPEARRQEVRPPGRQGAGRRGRADQAAQRGALPARRHGRARASSSPAPTPRRRRSSTAAATSATSRSSSARPTSTCPATRSATWRSCKQLPRAGRRRDPRPPALRDLRRRSTTRPIAWLERAGVTGADRRRGRRRFADGERRPSTPLLDEVDDRFVDAWQAEAGLKTYGEAVADVIEFRAGEGEQLRDERRRVARVRRAARRSTAPREQAKALGINIIWDCELPKTPEGYYQIRGGIDYAIAKSLAAAPVRRHPVDGDQDRRTSHDAQALRRGDPRRVTRTRCWPTTCRRRSTGTPPA